MLKTSTKIHLERNYAKKYKLFIIKHQNWSEHQIHPPKSTWPRRCQETLTPIVLCTLLHQASGFCACSANAKTSDASGFTWLQTKYYKLSCSKHTLAAISCYHNNEIEIQVRCMTLLLKEDSPHKSPLSYLNFCGPLTAYLVLVVKVASHKDNLSREDLNATTCKAPDQANNVT